MPVTPSNFCSPTVCIIGRPHGGGGEVLVEAVNESHVVFQQQLSLFDQRRIEHAHRRAAVAGDEHAGLEAAARVGAHLIEGQSNQRVDTTQMDVAVSFVRLLKVLLGCT